jgi:hypothetical protein
MMEAVSTSETSVSYNETTRRNIPEGSNLQKRPYPYRESKRGPLALVSHLTNWAMSTNIDISRFKTCAWCFTLLVYSWSCQNQCHWSSIIIIIIIRGATALTNLGRLSSRRWQYASVNIREWSSYLFCAGKPVCKNLPNFWNWCCRLCPKVSLAVIGKLLVIIHERSPPGDLAATPSSISK